jgi:hypothetical protein
MSAVEETWSTFSMSITELSHIQSSRIITPLAISLSLLYMELLVLYAHLFETELQLAHHSGRVKREGCRRIIRLSISLETLDDSPSY